MKTFRVFVTSLILSILCASRVHAQPAHLQSIESLNGTCRPVSWSTFDKEDRAWDVESGITYRFTISEVYGCGESPDAHPCMVRIANSVETYIEMEAERVSFEVWQFDFEIPKDCVVSFWIEYCVSPGSPPREHLVSTWKHQIPLVFRSVWFDPSCQYRTVITSPECGTATEPETSWGMVKSLYE